MRRVFDYVSVLAVVSNFLLFLLLTWVCYL